MFVNVSVSSIKQLSIRYQHLLQMCLQCPPGVCVEDASVAYVAALLCDVLPARTEQIQLD